MSTTRRSFLLNTTALGAYATCGAKPAAAQERALDITTPMEVPDWALLERAVLDAHLPACEAFYNRYFDERGYLLIKVRWGTLDGPDDAIENVNDWPYVYALGGSERIRQMYEKAYEGHVREYTEAKTTEEPLGREGMYFREFPPTIDWQHVGEGLSVFNLIGLGDPYSKKYRDRVRRFAGFYTGEDPIAKNYDKEHKIIRSMWNGSRGPLMRKANPLDWTGDRFDLAGLAQQSIMHGENSYDQMLGHFPEYVDTTGDNPMNLESTGLAANAYMLSHQRKYRDWIIEYVDAWADRARRNNDILPTNIGLDGTIGGEAGGKWYGGVYGWSFSPVVPQTGKREDRNRIGFSLLGFFNAYLVTGDDKYLDVWRRMADRIDSNAKMVDGKMSSPTMYGDHGWYSFKPGRWSIGSQDIYMMSMKPSDRARAPDHPFLLYLEGHNPGYPAEALRAALVRINKLAAETRADETTPDTRLADTVMDQNPASVTALIELMEGGIHIARPGWSKLSPGVGGALHFSRLRYFDPIARRPGIPPNVAALVESLTADTAVVTLINMHPTEPRTVTIQGGAYGEHQILSVANGATLVPVNARSFDLGIYPGSGAKLTIRMRRFANQPTLSFPWDSYAGDLTSQMTDEVSLREAAAENRDVIDTKSGSGR